MKITDYASNVLEETADQYMDAARNSTGSDSFAFRERSYGVRAAISVLTSHEASTWPPEAAFRYGDPVEKFTGEARWEGVIVSAYRTTAGKLRYVVEVKPQGFQMIAVSAQLRARG